MFLFLFVFFLIIKSGLIRIAVFFGAFLFVVIGQTSFWMHSTLYSTTMYIGNNGLLVFPWFSSVQISWRIISQHRRSLFYQYYVLCWLYFHGKWNEINSNSIKSMTMHIGNVLSRWLGEFLTFSIVCARQLWFEHWFYELIQFNWADTFCSRSWSIYGIMHNPIGESGLSI